MAVWSIVDFQEVQQTLRYDAEYYRPEYRENVAFLRSLDSCPVVPLKEKLLALSGGATPLGANYPATGIPFLRVQNIMPGYLDLSDVEYIEPEMHRRQLARSRLLPGDVLLTITGMSYGKAAYVTSALGEANINQHSVRMAFSSDLVPEYVAMFLNSRFGKLQSDKLITGITRPALNYEDIKSILIPVLPMSQQLAIKELAQQAEKARQDATRLYTEADSLLLQELGLGRMTLPTAKTYTAPFAEVMAAERMDAEFFRPQHRFILEHLRNKFAGRTLGELGTVTKGKTPADYVETGIPVVRSGDLSDIDATASFLRADPADVRFELQPGDVLISSIGFGSIGKVQVFNSPARHTTVNEVTVVRQRALNPYYLRTFLASPLGQIQIGSWVTGATGQLHLNPKDVMKIVVPMVAPTVQAQFETLYVEAQRLKLEAVELLAAAQRRVEEFIQSK